VIEPGEACDDGDLEAGDGCSLSCAVEVATCPTDGPPGHWDTWTCDNTREPTPCQPTRCTPESRAPVCQRRHQVRVVIRAHGRSEAAQPAARVRAPGIGIDCACLDGASTETCLDACHVEATPCSRAVLEVELREDVRLVGWETRGEPECGPDRQRCLVPTDGAIDAVVKVHVPYMVEPVLQLRYRCNHLAPARGGGFLVAGGSYELEQTDDGERNLFIGNIDRVEDDLRQRWTARLPYNMYAASLASDGSGGAVATVTTNEAVTLNEMSFSERGEGLIAFDHRGQWRWGKVLALGVHRTPHRIAVEPSPSGRIAVAIRDIVGQQISGDGSSSDQWGVRVWIFTPDGRQQASFFRRWYNAVGLAWPRPDRLLILGDRWGELDPAQRLIPRTEGSDSVDPVEPGLIGVVELVDPRSGQIYWRREWRRLTQGWEAVPAVGAEGAVSFIDIFTEDQAVERVHGVLPQRLVVLDATTGAVQRTRLLDSPRHCPSLYRIASDPRNGDWLMTQLRECAGSVERHPTAILVERAALDGRTRWTEVIGRPNVEGTRVERSRTPRISVIETAVSESGHTALIGSAGFSWILGQRINDDLRHFMLVISP
jgi:cysteine-rich repeat protein